MIEKANIAAKPILTATQMLESMVKSNKPSRAEASDVACAVLDGTDAVLLSSETAHGSHPISAVTMMAKICAEAERCIDYKQTFNDIRLYTTAPLGTAEAIASETNCAPWFFSPLKATKRSPGSTLFVLCVIPVIFTSFTFESKANFFATSPNDTGFTLGRANFI